MTRLIFDQVRRTLTCSATCILDVIFYYDFATCTWFLGNDLEISRVVQNDSQALLRIKFVVKSGAHFDGDFGEILALGAEISPYVGLREKCESPKKFFFF